MTTPTPNIAEDPLAKAVLRALATQHGSDQPLGSFARSVLSGQAGLREAASQSWHGEALSHAFTSAIDAQARLSPAQRQEISNAGRLLHSGLADGTAADHAERDRPGGGDYS